MSTSRTELIFFSLISLTLPILYIPVIFYLSQKETMVMQLLNDIVIFFLDIYHSKFPPLCHALVSIRLDGP